MVSRCHQRAVLVQSAKPVCLAKRITTVAEVTGCTFQLALTTLHHRLAAGVSCLAEGGVNFWDSFRLIPVDTGFWLKHNHYRVFPARHHLPDSAFGLALPGQFFYSGDTRPIPEQLLLHASQGEVILHDARVTGDRKSVV